MFNRHRMFKVMAALLILLGFAFGPGGTAPASASQPAYVISPAHSGHWLDVEGASTADGARIIQWYRSWNGGCPTCPSRNQVWYFDAVPGAYDTYYIRSFNSNKVLTVFSFAPGAAVVQWTNNSVSTQQWQQIQVGAAYKYRNVATGLYLDVSGASYAAGAPLIQWYQSSGLNQQFYTEQLGS